MLIWSVGAGRKGEYRSQTLYERRSIVLSELNTGLKHLLRMEKEGVENPASALEKLGLSYHGEGEEFPEARFTGRGVA
jgi:hypothetical protein